MYQDLTQTFRDDILECNKCSVLLGLRWYLMHYLIEGKLIRADLLRLPHEEFVQQLQTKFLPTLRLLVAEKAQGTVVGGGAQAGGRDIVLMVDLPGQSHRCVRQFLSSLPFFDYYEWKATPLESIEELLQALGG